MYNSYVWSIDRVSSLNRMCPKLFDRSKILYVGASKLRFQFLEQMKDCVVDVVEIFDKNVEHLKTIKQLNKVYHADIIDFMPTCHYDYVIWNHGPSNVSKEQIEPVLKKLESFAKKAVVLGCPNGIFEQGEVYGNKYESHLSHLDNNFFNELGYTTECLGSINCIGSHITAVKFNESFSPWFVPKSVSYIHNYIKDRKDCSIFEFGCGRSTVWFNQFSKNIIAIEHDKSWAESISSQTTANVMLLDRPYNDVITKLGKTYDIISVDGRDRVQCVKSSIGFLNKNGIFILDDSSRVNYSEAVMLLNDRYGDGIKFYSDRETTIWRN